MLCLFICLFTTILKLQATPYFQKVSLNRLQCIITPLKCLQKFLSDLFRRFFFVHLMPFNKRDVFEAKHLLATSTLWWKMSTHLWLEIPIGDVGESALGTRGAWMKYLGNLHNHYRPEGILLFARIPVSHFLDSRVWNDCHGWMQHIPTDRKGFPWTCLWEDTVQWLSPQHPGVVPRCSHQTLIWNPTLNDGNVVNYKRHSIPAPSSTRDTNCRHFCDTDIS